MEWVRSQKFYAVLNHRVFVPNLGHPLDYRQARDIVNGIADVILTIILEGNRVNFGELGSFKPSAMRAGWRWNPVTGKKFKGEKIKRITFLPTADTKRRVRL